ncbi:hypothetical protein [Kordiimonas sp.]|uniref:hypothetical protein n=1 Tax=Kordiimonas sp. TaxID=1970157 RepID=UPI003A8F0D4E
MLPSPQAAAQSPDWESVFSEWSKNHPEQVQLWEKAKQDAEKNEKRIKDLSDKAFQQSFDAVFGKDVYKPSEALGVMKALEAASAGDFHAAGETTNALLISRYMPVLGQYITAMNTLASGIRSAEQVWIKGLEETPAYERFITIYAERKAGRGAYIPSYMITYLRNNKLLGGEITKIYNDMRAREDRMFERWQSDTFEIERLRLAPWASQWRSARGKVPDPRQMFNYFLYNLVKDAKHVYLERFTDEYIRPLIRREAYNQEQKIAHTMAAALQSISAQAASGDNPAAQCAAHARSYQENIAAMSGKKREILSFYSRVKTAYTRKFDSYLRSDNAIQAERRRPLEEEKERLEADHKKALALKEEADRLDERLRSMGSEISSMRAVLPPTSDTSAHNAAISSLNAKISSYNSFRSSEYLPAKRAADAAGEAYNEAADAHDAKQEAFYGDKVIDSQNQRLVRQFTRIRKSMEYFNAPQRTCLNFAKVAMEDNMQQLIGMDPAPGIAMCNVWETHRQAALKSGKASQADNCGK